MKANFLFFISFLLFGNIYAQSYRNFDQYIKPPKKQTALPANFEVIIGEKITLPIDQQRFHHAVILSANDLSLSYKPNSSNSITLSNRTAQWELVILVNFGEDEYWYEYLSSRNLNADPKTNRMPDNYLQFLEDLDHKISFNYQSEKSIAAPQVPSVQSANPTPHSSQPYIPKIQRKKPMKEYNFEVISGKHLPLPLQEDIMRDAIIYAAKDLGYHPLTTEDPNKILLFKTNGSWWIKIQVCFWEYDYWFEYVDSFKLKADPVRNKIHRNYYRWIQNLDSRIAVFYKKFSHTQP